MPRILITNDDGVRSDGIHAVADALGALGDVVVVAPHVEASASGHYDFGPSARAASTLAKLVLERGLPARTFLNVNVPPGQPKGFRVTVQAKRNHVTVVDERCDPRGKAYYWIEEGQNDWEPHDR